MPGGLITPIVRNAETKSLSVISNEMRDLAARARERKLKPHEYQGGTSSVSNLGMYGIKDFTAVINPPQSTILAVGTGEERAVVRNGKIEAAHDHERDAVLRSSRRRRRAWRRTHRRVQNADREPGDDGGLMPLVRIDLRKGKSAAYKKAIADGVYRAMRETFVVPDEDRFMVITEHDDDEFFYSKTT